MAAKGTLVNVLKETEITMGSALLDEKHRPKFFGSLNFRVACGIVKIRLKFCWCFDTFASITKVLRMRGAEKIAQLTETE